MAYGTGMVIATSEPDKVLAEAASFGMPARAIGEITDQPGIRIQNRGSQQREAWLTF